MTERVGSLDGFLIAFGRWLDVDTEDPEAHTLAATILRAEIEWRESTWDALGVLLDHVVDGHLLWPDDPAERASVFEAVEALGWDPAAPVVGLPPALPDPPPPNTPATPTKGPDVPDPTTLPPTWGDVKKTYATWAEWDAAQNAADTDPTNRKDAEDE